MNKKFIINLANENLTDGEISVLGRGLNFIKSIHAGQGYRSIHEKNAHPLSNGQQKRKTNPSF